MKIFLSALQNKKIINYFLENIPRFKYNLLSYYYIMNDIDIAVKLRETSELIMIDSGAHSFQKGKKVNWVEYTKQYAEFIKEYDRPNVLGYFEMDVDNIIGYNQVLELRSILESVSDKIIPVWHKNRGIKEFKKMCQDYSGKIIAITGFKNEDIKDEQYLMFLKYAKKYNCKVHCLGMTRKKILDKIPFDYVDSSSWIQSTVYGTVYFGKGRFAKAKGEKMNYQYLYNYKQGMKVQEYYYNKWKKVCKD